MYSTTTNNIKSKQKLEIVKELCRASKDLFNKTLYDVRQHFFVTGKYLNYEEAYKVIKNNKGLDGIAEYEKLPSNASQQTMKKVDQSFKSFFALHKKYKNDKSKKVSIPRYLEKNGYFTVIFTKIHINFSDNNYVKLTLPKIMKKRFKDEKKDIRFLDFKIPKNVNYQNIKEIHLVPTSLGFKISFVCLDNSVIQQNNNCHNKNNYMSIDLGINNLATIVTQNDFPLLIDGKKIKSINRHYSKVIANLQSIAKKSNDKYHTTKLNVLYNNRNLQIKDIMHKIANYIVNYANYKNITTIVIGYNKSWKDAINIGSVNNQKFSQIPHSTLIEYIEHKAEKLGIKVIRTEESYTSKTDSLALEKICKHKKYQGKRVKRGLFQSSVKKLINSDVNGAINILRKVFNGKSIINSILNNQLIFNPKRVKVIV